eukprot:CAMPEP_0181114216 /NCGR_PEP_ID=MMETSP1071-20121207/20759_1 /TAXON_ID=35127 /ORGANISM="Thalassiosira sp., Strain NH16" /LENGTH=291 /DNA_ID=CAMNT_0023198299 /DNA_START=22 /DNA_END=897 /DNA_ORIENTATION=+
MARGRNNHHGAGGGALLACNRAIDRADEQKGSVKKLQARVKMIASAIRPDSDIANVLHESDPNADDFLLSCRNRIKAIAEGNAKRMYEIDNFTDAMKEVRTDVERRQNENQGSGEEGGDEDAPDYERAIHEAVETIRQHRENDQSRVEPVDHELAVELRKELGEKIQKKRSRTSRGGDDEEDDLEIVQGQNDDIHTLKCPITGMLFKNPVKNKVCGHVYDMAGLEQMVRTGKTNCPIPGCGNKGVTFSQVEEDEEMKLKVKRHLAREEAEKRKRDLEEEDDDQEGAGFTIL